VDGLELAVRPGSGPHRAKRVRVVTATRLEPAAGRTLLRHRLSEHYTLGILVVGGAALIAALSALAPVPNTMDEIVYIELARNFAHHGSFAILGKPFPALTYAPAYVVLIAPIYKIASTATQAYQLVRGLNALLFASAAIPTFFIAIRAMPRRSALIVSAAAIALPAGVYASKVQTESAAFPLVLWCALAALRVLERPTPTRQLVLLLTAVLAAGFRFQLLVLLPALALACALATTPRSIGGVRRLAPLLVGTIVTLSIVAGAVSATSEAAAGGGAHGFAADRLSPIAAAKQLIGMVGALDLAIGVLPMAVFIAAAATAHRRPTWMCADVRRVVLVAIAATASLLVTGSVYLATVPPTFRPPNPSERYIYYVIPLLLIVFGAWLERAPRPYRLNAWAAASAAALPVLAAIAFMHAAPRMTYSGLAFLPWLFFGWIHPLVLVAVLAVACGWLASKLRRGMNDRAGVLSPLLALGLVTLLFAYFLVISTPVTSPEPGWLDAHAEPGTIVVWASTPTTDQSQGLEELIAGNSNLAAVYFAQKPDSRGVPQVETRVTRRSDGTLLHGANPLRARYVLTAAKTRLVGTLVAKQDGFAIYRVPSVVRIADAGATAR
jgi:hypothetical protein